MVDFVNLFKTTATAKNLEFLYGRLDNIELKLDASKINQSDGLMYVLPVTVTHVLNQGVIGYNEYSTTLGLCRLAYLENYYDEKYELALKEMSSIMESYLKLLTGCSANLTLLSAKIDFEINKFSENLDVVLCDLTFSDE